MPAINFAVIGFLSALLALAPTAAAEPEPPSVYLQFDGIKDYAELSSSADFSVSADGLTVSVWMRPDTLTFPKTEGSVANEQFVHLLGKGLRRRSGELAQQEWVFRMYSQPGPRENRISFYIFNLDEPPPHRGCGVAFQDPVESGQWVHVVGVVANRENAKMIHIYKNGELRTSFFYGGRITPEPGGAPLRIGTREGPVIPTASWFQGALAQVRIWNLPLSEEDVSALYNSNIVPPGLVAEYLLNDSRFVSGRNVEGYVSATWGSDSNPVINATTGSVHTGC